ncbi:WbuC family cupin fold metalloprotein [Morganella morganii]|uniref:WbuC family cupin fold metalloprotein n=1 Tax=Morganella morganii TaxID=582 RepID=UPI000D1E3AD8|nr:WbuC family cupin fold metalloprotein [Morganella morganii]QXO42838.1 WbuC family cupin fold metalloprotein [Morganella morganii]QXO50165.1 WbuC family cupin fold metalloprotein [Morganella morganii]HAS8353517.1 cupin fold metalloprotein, WbuC family [Vibrio vulnificus]
MRLIDNNQLEKLYRQAEQSVRLRTHLLMHNSHQDKVQRLLIALVKDSFVEPHYHEFSHQWEMFVVMQGELQVRLHSKNGEVIKEFIAGSNSGVSIVEFSPGDIHSVKCLSTRALMMEVKEGPFSPYFAKAFIV